MSFSEIVEYASVYLNTDKASSGPKTSLSLLAAFHIL